MNEKLLDNFNKVDIANLVNNSICINSDLICSSCSYSNNCDFCDKNNIFDCENCLINKYEYANKNFVIDKFYNTFFGKLINLCKNDNYFLTLINYLVLYDFWIICCDGSIFKSIDVLRFLDF